MKTNYEALKRLVAQLPHHLVLLSIESTSVPDDADPIFDIEITNGFLWTHWEMCMQ